MVKPKILAFAGSLRKNSYNKRILNIAVEGARRKGAEVTLLDLNEYPLPLYNADLQEELGFPENASILQQILLEHQGLLIASPEYNGSLPAALKNMLDWTSRANGELKIGDCYRGKWAAIMTASPGNFGGIRCLGHLRDILSIMLVHVLPLEIAVSRVDRLFDGDSSEMKDESMRLFIESLGESLAEVLIKSIQTEKAVK
ncbi:MAG: NADPH-dependent oxidoreductase [Acidobacteria bacterium]|jgi:NAD(P)H-dependent FMN reductase|nr:MAG: NADPH-dependent oxidoreductase [Acidobacteriota bacterium]GIU82051.1 MAG: FMN reductase [Pyrinomonadaceae bacterium]